MWVGIYLILTSIVYGGLRYASRKTYTPDDFWPCIISALLWLPILLIVVFGYLKRKTEESKWYQKLERRVSKFFQEKKDTL